MTVGRRQYNEAEMLQMQREAENRVREMQHRARSTVDSPPPLEQRGWSSGNGTPSRQRPMRWPGPYQNQQPQSRSGPAPKNPAPVREKEEKPARDPAAPLAEACAPKKSGTLVGDVMDALNLDEDYLLIIGLILILLNRRADTTLILALAYLLI